jgi:protein-S-isoprenylcysteine O-methyltransferase Ste14
MDSMDANIAFVISFTAFAVVHSLTASSWLKSRAEVIMGGWYRHYRLIYSLFSVLTFFPAFYIWTTNTPTSPVIYSAPQPLHLPMNIIRGLCILGMGAALLENDAMTFLGLKARMQGVGGLKRTRLYSIVRNPIFSFAILYFWARPVMTSLDLLVSVLVTAYFIIGAFHEEKRLLAEYGEEYAKYKKNVPMFIPKLTLGKWK